MKMTVDEIVGALKRSRLPTVLVEGVDDMDIMRLLEDEIAVPNVSFMGCGGRKTLIGVFERRAEFAQIPAAFLADRDFWVFSAIPAQFTGIVFTDGYSIENDIYSDADLERLLSRREKNVFEIGLTHMVDWFAFEVDCAAAGAPCEMAHHPSRVLESNGRAICRKFAASRGLAPANPATVSMITGGYRRLLRGKTLVQLLLRYLSAPDRPAKFSRAALMELGLKMACSRPRIDTLLTSLRSQLQAHPRSGP